MPQQVFNSAEAQQIMREILDSNMYKQFEEEAVTYNMFPDGSADFVSDVGAQWVVELEPNPGIRGMSGTQTTFHAGSTSKRNRQKVTYAQLAITRRFDGNTLYTDVKSLVRGWAPMVKQDVGSFIKHLNLLWHGDGTGSLGTVAAYDPNATGTAVLQLTQPIGATAFVRRARVNVTTNDGNYTRHTYTTGGNPISRPFIVVKTGSDTISLASDEGATVADTVSSQTIVAGDVIQMDDAGGIMPHGFGYHFNNSVRTYQNLNTGSFPQLIPPIYDAGNGPLSVRIMDFLEYDCIFRAGMEQTLDGMFWLLSATQIAAYKKLGYNTEQTVVKRFAAGDRELDLGYTTVKHNGRMFVLDTDADPTRMLFLNRPTWQKFLAKPPSVVNDSGEVLNKVYATTGERVWSYTFDINFMGELANKQIYKNGAIINLQWTGLPAKRDVVQF